MISPRKLIKMARKWQKAAAIGRKRISFPRKTSSVNGKSCSTSNEKSCSTSSSIAEKGHFVVYSADQRRFMIPLEYLNNDIFIKLFEMSEEEFGLPRNGPITLPCDSVIMTYVISLIQRHAIKDLEEPLLMSIATFRCTSSTTVYSHQGQQTDQQLLICSF